MGGLLQTANMLGAVSSKSEHEASGGSDEITDVSSYRETTFRFMVFYRWLALVAALLLTFFLPGDRNLALPLIITGITLAYTLAITLTRRPLNRLLRRYPPLLGVDLIFVGGLLTVTGGWRSPYYLYALSPILAAAFFFRWRGALIAASVLAVLFGLSLWWQWLLFETPPAWEIALTYLIGFYLIGIIFSFPATLLRRLRQAHNDLRIRNADLSRAHQELQIIHDLTRTMQSASDSTDVQEQLLKALVGPLDFSRAVIAITNPATFSLSSWLSQDQVSGSSTPLPHIAHISLETDRGSLAESLRQGRSQTILNGQPPCDDPTFNEQLALGDTYAVYPLILRQQSLGVVAIRLSEPKLTPSDEATLTSIANQAAVALGNVQLCIDRTRRLTKEEERNRIAREIHDNVSQSLFGFVYTLDSCIKLLPEQSDTVKTRLVNLHPQAVEVMNKVRQSIYDLWEADVTVTYFQSELQRYTRQVCQNDTLALQISVDEEFAILDPNIRRTFLRVAQEGITNVVKHAQADQATIAVIISDAEATLVVADNGTGFKPETVELAPHQGNHFGLLSMQERINLLEGHLRVDHRCDRGTLVMATVPLNGETS